MLYGYMVSGQSLTLAKRFHRGEKKKTKSSREKAKNKEYFVGAK